MATVTAGKYGIIYAESDLGWSPGVRTATSGNSLWNQTTSTNINTVQAAYSSGSKGSVWIVVRMFLAFNVTAYQTGYTLSDMRLYYVPTTSTVGSSGAGMKMALVKSTAQGNANTNLALADFNNFDDSVDYAANDGSQNNTWRDLSSLQYVDLNATAITAITGTGYLKICIMEYLFDYPNTAPTVNPTAMKAYGNFGSTVPYLSFTATAAGYGNNIIGVEAGSIGDVISVSRSDISEVIGV